MARPAQDAFNGKGAGAAIKEVVGGDAVNLDSRLDEGATLVEHVLGETAGGGGGEEEHVRPVHPRKGV